MSSYTSDADDWLSNNGEDHEVFANLPASLPIIRRYKQSSKSKAAKKPKQTIDQMAKTITKKIEIPIRLLMELGKLYIENMEGIKLPNKGDLIESDEAMDESSLDDFSVRFEYPADYTKSKSDKAVKESTERKISFTL